MRKLTKEHWWIFGVAVLLGLVKTINAPSDTSIIINSMVIAFFIVWLMYFIQGIINKSKQNSARKDV